MIVAYHQILGQAGRGVAGRGKARQGIHIKHEENDMSKLAHIMDARETVTEMLQRIIDSGDADEATSGMVLLLHETPETYRSWHEQARINRPQMIALLVDNIREVQDEMREDL